MKNLQYLLNDMYSCEKSETAYQSAIIQNEIEIRLTRK